MSQPGYLSASLQSGEGVPTMIRTGHELAKDYGPPLRAARPALSAVARLLV